MDNQIFRQKSLDQISSPEQLTDYLRVTNPAVWLLLIAVVLLLVGALIWSSTATIDSYATGTAQVENGKMTITFDQEQIAASVETGMTVELGEERVKVSSIGTGADGKLFATADTTLADGSYTAKILLRQTQVLRLLFN